MVPSHHAVLDGPPSHAANLRQHTQDLEADDGADVELLDKAITLDPPRDDSSRSNGITGQPSSATERDDTPRSSTNKVLFLDGLRGLAAIIVVLEHSFYLSGSNLGIFPVDVFFVLSSYLLTLIFFKKSEKLLAQQTSYRKWGFSLVDYFCKRFLRAYPLFAIVATVMWLLPFRYKQQFMAVPYAEHYQLFKVLTFDSEHRYHIFWTLPLEIGYYFLIPIGSLVLLRLRRWWWVPLLPLSVWIVHEGVFVNRSHHQPLVLHLPTFAAGSMAAVIFAKLESAIKRKALVFSTRSRLCIRLIEYCVLALLLSTCFRGLLFEWVFPNPVPPGDGAAFISLHVASLIVVEMLFPSELAKLLEWNVLRYWGKISFSVYLLHVFVVYLDCVRRQSYYNKLFAQFGLIYLLATASYYLVEYPCQRLSARISKALTRREASEQLIALPQSPSECASGHAKGTPPGNDVIPV